MVAATIKMCTGVVPVILLPECGIFIRSMYEEKITSSPADDAISASGDALLPTFESGRVLTNQLTEKFAKVGQAFEANGVAGF